MIKWFQVISSSKVETSIVLIIYRVLCLFKGKAETALWTLAYAMCSDFICRYSGEILAKTMLLNIKQNSHAKTICHPELVNDWNKFEKIIKKAFVIQKIPDTMMVLK